MPSADAPILFDNNGHIAAKSAVWGFPGFQKNQLIINARAETVKEKRMFFEHMAAGRCIIPAAGFYEWDKSRNKFTFERANQAVLFMAGIYQRNELGDLFVIITTAANASMEPVHPRMPLILEKEQMNDWLFQVKAVDRILKTVPMPLEKNTELEQMRLDLF